MATSGDLINRRVHVSLGWLLVTAALGIVLRLFPIMDLPLNFKNVLHAHSHVAFLGWVFNSFFALLAGTFMTKEKAYSKNVKLQFILLQVFNGGMLISFLMQGYAFFSILFSSLHMLTTFWFAITLYKIQHGESKNTSIPQKFLYAALFFMILSSLGPLSIPVINNFYGSGSETYHNAIYFYLHFQYNGWFIFSIFALLFKHLQNNGIKFNTRSATNFFRLLFISCIGSYALSVLWCNPPQFIRLTGGSAAIVQLIAFGLLCKIIFAVRHQFSGNPAARLFVFAFGLFGIKLLLQFLSAFPFFTDMMLASRQFIIGYLHLVLLGIVSVSLFAFFIQNHGLNSDNFYVRSGILLFLAGICATELMAFGQGLCNYFSTSIPAYNYIQAALSLLLPAGIFLILFEKARTAYKPEYRLKINPAII